MGSQTTYASDPMTDTVLIEDQTEEPVQPMRELAECTCPDWCERDHELD